MFFSNNEEISDWDQFSGNISFKDFNNLDSQSICLEDTNIKNEVNFRILINMNKNIDNSKFEPSIQEKTSKTKLEREKLLTINNFISFTEEKKPYFEISQTNKARGRKKTKRERNNKSPLHDKYSKDNLLRKIKIHSINFILDLVNFLLNIFGEDIQFRIITYKFKREVNNKDILSLKKMTIKEILCQNLSSKIKIRKNEDNTFIFNSIKESIIKNLLDSNYLDVFQKLYYYNKEKKINLKDYGSDFDRIYYFTNKIKIFEDLLEENKNQYRYAKKLNECVKDNLLNEKLIKNH